MRIGPCIAVVSLALVSVAAKADSTIGTPTTSDLYGSAILTTGPGVNGVYTITGIQGSAGFGLGVTSLLPVGTFQNNDNLLYPNSATQLVDGQGFAFADTEGDTDFDVDVYSPSANKYMAYVQDLDPNGTAQDVPITLTVTPGAPDPTFTISFAGVTPAATPEPSSLALLGTGVLGVAGLVRRRIVG